MINRKWVWPLLIVNFLALLDSIYLTWHHYKIEILKPVIGSFCTINSYINCDLVATSSYSRFLGMPTSSLGIFAYLFLSAFFTYFLFYKKEDIKSHLNLSFVVILVMCLFSLKQFIASLIMIKAICIMCVGLYICIILMVLFNFLILGKLSLKSGGKTFIKIIKFKNTRVSGFYFITVIISICIAIIFSYMTAQYFENSISVKKEVVVKKISMIDVYNDIPQKEIDYSNLPYKGAKDAPFVFLEVSDFQCPFCGIRGQSLIRLIERFDGLVKIYFLHYPLDQKCNKDIIRKFHDFACSSAKYAICAGEQGKFWKFHDYLFKYQKKINGGFLKSSIVNSKLSIDKDKFLKCLKGKGKRRLSEDLAQAYKLVISYTPTIYLNGREISKKFAEEEMMIALLEEIMKTTLDE